MAMPNGRTNGAADVVVSGVRNNAVVTSRRLVHARSADGKLRT
jgi:hypothetical protein